MFGDQNNLASTENARCPNATLDYCWEKLFVETQIAPYPLTDIAPVSARGES